MLGYGDGGIISVCCCRQKGGSLHYQLLAKPGFSMCEGEPWEITNVSPTKRDSSRSKKLCVLLDMGSEKVGEFSKEHTHGPALSSPQTQRAPVTFPHFLSLFALLKFSLL